MANKISIYVCFNNKFLRLKNEKDINNMIIEWLDKPWEATKFKSSTYKNRFHKYFQTGIFKKEEYDNFSYVDGLEAYKICFENHPEYIDERIKLNKKRKR